MAEMVKGMLCARVKLCVLTFTSAKLDVTLHSIRNINLSQNMAASSPVIQPLDGKEAQRSTFPPPHPLPSACNSMTTSA